MMEQLVLWEKELFLTLHAAHSPYWDAFMYLISSRWPWIAVAAGLVVYLFAKKPVREALLFILMVALLITLTDQLTSGLIKPFFQRERPSWHPITQDLVQSVYGYKAWGYGFVSGHAANFFALALFSALAFRNKAYGGMVFALAVTVAYSRIYLGVHFVTDVIAGMLIGLLLGYLVYLLYRRLRIWLFKLNPAETPGKVFAPTIRYFTAFLGVYVLFLFAFSAELTELMQGRAGW